MADVPVNDEVPSIVVDVLANGQVLFDYDFRADAADDLQAEYRYANGDRLDLAGGVDFTATGLGTAAGGTITLTTFIDTVAGDTIAIYRKIPIERTTDYSRDLFADDLNAEQDRLFMIAQELRRDIDRAVKADFGDNPDTLVEDLFAAALQAEADAAAAAASASASAASQVAAAGSASSASTSATNASNSATAADASADAAAASQAAAAGAASSASTSATNAGNSASAASTSATNAANSATAAGTAATNAANSATAAAGSASAANTSATNAANSATAAQNSANAAAAKFVPNVLTASAEAAPGYISSANGFGYSQNTTGSTGYPGVFGETVSFMFGGGGRAWDMWKGASGAEDWHLRSNLSGGSTFGPWRRIIHDGLKATQAQAEAGTDNTNYMTPLATAQEIDGRATKLFGSSSLARTIPARFGDVIDLDDWLDGSGSSGTAAANNAALALLVAYMAGAGAGKTYRSRMGRIFSYSAAFAIPAGVRLRLEGAMFRFWGNTLSGTPTITLGTGVDVDTLIVHVPSGSFSKRFINVRGCRANLLKVVSDVQINNWGSSNLDFGIQIYGRNSLGEENRIDEVYTDGLNKGIIVCGDSFSAADPQRGGYIGYCRVKNYEKGVVLRNVDGMSLRGGWANLRSASAVIGDPGCNGLLLDATANMQVRDWLIEDSAEHGFRCGGDPTGVETKNRNLTINGMTIRRAQQCGFKIWGGDLSASARLDGAAISNVIVEDAAATNPATTGFNYSAFLIQHVQFGTFSNLQCFTNAQAWTGREGFFLGAINRSTFQGIRAHNARVNAVRISEFNSGESSTDFLASNNGVKIEGVYSEGHTGDAVYLDSPSQSLRDIVITDGNFVAGVNAFNANAIAGRFAQPCVFEAAVRGHSGALSALPASANITTINKRTSVA